VPLTSCFTLGVDAHTLSFSLPALPDDPPFPMPDFKQIGRNILANPCMGMWEEEPGEVPVLHLSHTWDDVKAGGYVEEGDLREDYQIKRKSEFVRLSWDLYGQTLIFRVHL
jgi:hypothetical protein